MMKTGGARYGHDYGSGQVRKGKNPYTSGLETKAGLAPEQTSRGRGQKKAIPLNPQMTHLLWSMVHRVPTLRTSLRESQDLLFGTPFQIVLGSSVETKSRKRQKGQPRDNRQGNTQRQDGTGKNGKEAEGGKGGARRRLFPLNEAVRERVVERYWMPWLRDVDTWIRLFGLAPVRFRKLRGKNLPGPGEPATNSGAGRAGGKQGGAAAAAAAAGPEREEPPDTSFLFEMAVPVVPAFGTGTIETYVEDGQQRFQWRWNEEANMSHGRRVDRVDPQVFFIESTHLPDIYGQYRSEMVSLVEDYMRLEEMHDVLRRANEATQHPLRVVEFSPDIAKATGANAQHAEGDPMHSFSQVAFPAAMSYEEPAARPIEQIQAIRRDQQQQSGGARAPTMTYTAEADYMVPDRLGDTMPSSARMVPFKAENARDADGHRIMEQIRQRRDILNAHPEWRTHLADPHTFYSTVGEGANRLPPNTVVLEPYERMTTQTPATPDTHHLMAVQNRFDQMAAVLADYPQEMIMSMGGKGGGGGGGPGVTSHSGSGAGNPSGPNKMPQRSAMFQYVVTRQRARSSFYGRQVRRVFMMAHAATWREASSESQELFRKLRGRPPSEREVLDMERNLDVQVFFPRTPLLSFDEMAVYYQHGLFSEEDFRTFALDIVGMEERAPTQDYRKALQMLYREPVSLGIEAQEAQVKQAKKVAAAPVAASASGAEAGTGAGASGAGGSAGETASQKQKRSREQAEMKTEPGRTKRARTSADAQGQSNASKKRGKAGTTSKKKEEEEEEEKEKKRKKRKRTDKNKK